MMEWSLISKIFNCLDHLNEQFHPTFFGCCSNSCSTKFSWSRWWDFCLSCRSWGFSCCDFDCCRCCRCIRRKRTRISCSLKTIGIKSIESIISCGIDFSFSSCCNIFWWWILSCSCDKFIYSFCACFSSICLSTATACWFSRYGYKSYNLKYFWMFIWVLLVY